MSMLHVPRALAWAGVLGLLLTGPAAGSWQLGATTPSAAPAPARLQAWGRRYLRAWHRRHPGQASLDGVHDFDGRLASFSPASLREERRELDRFQGELDAIPESGLPFDARLDRRLAQDNLAWRRLELDELQPWRRNPMLYADEISNGLLWLALFPSSPAPHRLRALVARERAIPRLLREARQNLSNPPAVFVRVARESFEGLQGFVGRDLPAAFEGVGDPGLRRDFQASTVQAGAALAEFLAWLDRDLAPRAKGDFALGAGRYARLLRTREGISLPLDQLEAMGERELAAKEARFRELARALDPKATPPDVWAAQRKDHPRPDELLPEARHQVEVLERFVREKGLAAIPPHQPLVVAPTPAFLPGTFASQYMAGPFEPKAVPARYFVTLPDPSWSPARTEEHLEEYSRRVLWNTSAHEAFPGHFLQGIYLNRIHSPFRAGGTFASDCMVEGWAHYCEQLMVEQGFMASDPRYELGQVKDALLRAARFIVSIRLHTGRMTLDGATHFFMDRALMAEGPARTEAERGTYEPTYLSYTYGKLELLRLREELRARQGAAFSLARFHEDLLRTGQVPPWFLRAALLKEEP